MAASAALHNDAAFLDHGDAPGRGQDAIVKHVIERFAGLGDIGSLNRRPDGLDRRRHRDRRAGFGEDGDRRGRACPVALRRENSDLLVGDDLESGGPDRAADRENNTPGRGQAFAFDLNRCAGRA